MEAVDGSIRGQFRDQFASIEHTALRSRIVSGFMLVIALFGCSFGWWVLQYKVVLPLENLARRMRDIAEGDGDLTDRVEILGHNELDEVGRWFNVFIERVEQIVRRVSENALALADAAGSLAAIAQETASQSALQQDQTLNITGSMGEISSAAYEISQNTQRAAEDARKAEQNARAGGDTVQSAVSTMQALLVAKQATAAKVRELAVASDAIGRIIGVIDDISNQTSLLALNASIESARAGEHGRGFAVVAMEVRRLAERTGIATREIDQTVRAIQNGTAEVIESIRIGMLRAEERRRLCPLRRARPVKHPARVRGRPEDGYPDRLRLHPAELFHPLRQRQPQRDRHHPRTLERKLRPLGQSLRTPLPPRRPTSTTWSAASRSAPATNLG